MSIPLGVDRVWQSGFARCRVGCLALAAAGSLLAGESWTAGTATLSVQGVQIGSTLPPELRLQMNEQFSLAGSIPGNRATAGLIADLASGTFGQYASGVAPQANVFAGGTASVDAELSFHEGFLFRIPAGAYPDGLSVTYRGSLGGSLEAMGIEHSGSAEARRSNVQQTVSVLLTGPYGNADFSLVRVAYANQDPVTVFTDLSLSVPLLPAQTTLAADLETSLVLSGGLAVQGTAPNFFPFPDAVSSFHSDFTQTLKFTGIHAPPGVTWESASGVFLSVPEPGTGVLLVLGAAGLWVLSAGRYRHRS